MKKGQFPTCIIPPPCDGLVVWFEDERFGWSYPLWLARYGEGPTCGAVQDVQEEDQVNPDALLEAEAAEALAARRLLSAAGVRADAAAPSDIDEYRRCRSRAEELRRGLTDKMVVVGSREWGGNRRSNGPYAEVEE